MTVNLPVPTRKLCYYIHVNMTLNVLHLDCMPRQGFAAEQLSRMMSTDMQVGCRCRPISDCLDTELLLYIDH